ncbi:MAG: hypothetical protein ACKO85_19620 [Isosphaeraceae bacterium]
MKYLTIVVIVAISFVSVSAQQKKAELQAGLKLIQKGNEQADRGKVNEAQITYQEAMEKILPSVRNLPFKNTVKRDETPREKLGQVLVEDWEKEISPAEFQLDEATWKVLGLIPADFDLKSAYMKLLTEEVAAFYDPKTKTMHLIREPEKKPMAEAKPKGLLELIMGRDGGFDKDEAQSVIAHELTHALDDQHFDLDAMMEVVKDDDDASLALSALMEGEATMTMMAVGQDDWDGSKIVRTPAAGMDRMMRLLGPLMPLAGGETARKSPPVMYESLIFPYFQGLVFAASLTNQGGWAKLDQAYRNPPVSTEQVLHPEKYLGPEFDPPTAIEIPVLKLPDQMQMLGKSVIGELTIRIMLNRFGGRNAAIGWDGDTLAVFQSKSEAKRFAGIWVSTWDSAKDAAEFAKAVAAAFGKSGMNVKITEADTDVIVAIGWDDKAANELTSQLSGRYKKTEKKFNWDKKPQKTSVR